MFKRLGKSGALKRRPRTDNPRKNRSVLVGVDPRLKQVAYNRLAILRAYHRRLSKSRKPKTKTEVQKKFLGNVNSGILWPDGVTRSISHIGRSTLYSWGNLYKNGGIASLLPRYKTKLSNGKPIFQPLANPIEMKFPGPPRRNGKTNFLARIRRRWKNPVLECPIRLSIFYSMPVRKGTKMPRRMRMLKRQISHTIKPNLDPLNVFIVDCLTGTVFRDHSQIVQFHSEKAYEWWPQTRILIKTLSR